MELIRAWHIIRADLEHSIYESTGDKSVFDGSGGSYKHDIFQGHCSGKAELQAKISIDSPLEQYG